MSTPSAPNITELPGQGQAAQGYQQQVGAVSGMPNYAQQNYNTFAPQLTAESNAVGNAATAAGQGVQSSVAGLPGYATQLLNTGFDPQNALYSRTAQQLQDQTRAGLEARGVDSSPYGAGVEGQNMSNFNIDWQNTQLGREQAAATGASALLGEYGAGQTQGIGLERIAPTMTAGTLSALNAAGQQNYQQPQDVAAMELSYLNQGNQNAQTAEAAYNSQNALLGSGISGLFGGLGSIAGLGTQAGGTLGAAALGK